MGVAALCAICGVSASRPRRVRKFLDLRHPEAGMRRSGVYPMCSTHLPHTTARDYPFDNRPYARSLLEAAVKAADNVNTLPVSAYLWPSRGHVADDQTITPATALARPRNVLLPSNTQQPASTGAKRRHADSAPLLLPRTVS